LTVSSHKVVLGQSPVSLSCLFFS